MRYIVFWSILAVIGISAYVIVPPPWGAREALITVPEGASIKETARILKTADVINSETGFTLIARFYSGGVRAGTYLVPEPENAFSLAYRLAKGISAMTAVKITIPEGLTAREIAERIKIVVPAFNAEAFTLAATQEEGYLFPDTYFFSPAVTAEEAIAIMRANFETRIEPLRTEIETSGKTLHEVVTMASLIEEEARQSDTRKIVSGILWKRIDKKMPLQVDAVFGYILGKSGYAPTGSDLTIVSPYNTYLNRGLPPGPIANPSINSIEAALRPTETPYFYYLTGKDGNMYYAKTFEGHIANRKYLR